MIFVFCFLNKPRPKCLWLDWKKKKCYTANPTMISPDIPVTLWPDFVTLKSLTA